MTPYSFSLLFFSFCTFLIALLIWLKRSDEIGRQYFIFSIAVSVWSCGISFLFGNVLSYAPALFAIRLANAAAVFIPVTWLHFVLMFTDIRQSYRKLLFFLYTEALLIDCFSFSKWFIPKLEPSLELNYFTRAGPIYYIFTLTFAIIVPLAFYELRKKIKHSSGDEKYQLMGFFVATLVGFIGGGLTFVPVYKIDIPQYGLFLTPLYPFVMAYFMIRHRLFEIEQIAQAFQREKLATIGLIASSINHEIRNPLYIAKGTLDNYIELSKEGLKDKDPIEIAEKARLQIERALDVVQKLRRFAKPGNDETAEN